MEETLDTLRINTDRLYASLAELGKIGAYDVGEGNLQGVRRLTLTGDDRRGRELVIDGLDEA